MTGGRLAVEPEPEEGSGLVGSDPSVPRGSVVESVPGPVSPEGSVEPLSLREESDTGSSDGLHPATVRIINAASSPAPICLIFMGISLPFLVGYELSPWITPLASSTFC